MSNTYPVNVRLKNGVVTQIDNVQFNLPQTIKALQVKIPTTASRVTTVATVQYPDHGFVVGDSVVLSGVAPFNGTYTITSVTTNSFNFTVANSGATTDTPLVVRTELHVNEYRGGNGYHAKYILTQTIAALLASVPVGSVFQATIISGLLPNALEAVANGTTALFFTNKIVNLEQTVYPTLVFTDMDRALTVVTVTCAAHGLKVGDYITVDSSSAALDGTFQVATVPTSGTFTYVTTASGTVTDATGTGYKQNTTIYTYEEGMINQQYVVNELSSVLSLASQEVYPFWPIAAPQALSGAGAITITQKVTNWTTTGAQAATLADATVVGQVKKVLMVVDGGDGTLTPATFASGSTITFNDAGDYVELQWSGAAGWVVIENSGCTINPVV